MRRNKLNIARLPAAGLMLLALGACDVQSGVQGRYVSKQSECRSEAESRMSNDSANAARTAKQRNAQLVDHFSTCMIQSGWHVARPVKNPVVPTPPGTTRDPKEAALPAQPLPGQPSNVVTTAAPSSPENMPVKTQPSVLQPAPGQPALSAPATTQAPATYQRVPTGGSTGTPGRNF